MPEEAQIYVALGAALSADCQNPIALSDLLVKLKNREGFVPDTQTLRAFYVSLPCWHKLLQCSQLNNKSLSHMGCPLAIRG